VKVGDTHEASPGEGMREQVRNAHGAALGEWWLRVVQLGNAHGAALGKAPPYAYQRQDELAAKKLRRDDSLQEY
jgi:hypothetical protein